MTKAAKSPLLNTVFRLVLLLGIWRITVTLFKTGAASYCSNQPDCFLKAPGTGDAITYGVSLLGVALGYAAVSVVTRRRVSLWRVARLDKKTPFHLGIGFLTGGVIFWGKMALLLTQANYRELANAAGQISGKRLILAVALYFLVALLEEGVFRGGVFQLWAAEYGPRTALILSAIGFGALHATDGYHDFFDAILITIRAGLLFGAAYWLTRNLWLATGIHWGNDLVGGLMFGDRDFGIAPIVHLDTHADPILTFGKLIVGYVVPLLLAWVLVHLAKQNDKKDGGSYWKSLLQPRPNL